jgi:antitoxin component YwqK of YwqJK toxin-antitoxin module
MEFKVPDYYEERATRFRQDENGQKCGVSNHKDGMWHGEETYWHSKDVVSTKGQYHNDKRVGVWRSWHTNGHISSEGVYKNGERHGLWTYWHSQKTFDYVFSSRIEEQIATKMNYADGVLNGTCVEWHSNGNKKLNTSFSHGLKNGMYTRWHANGHKKTDGKYVANIDKNRQHKTGAWSYWNEDGRLTAKEAYREGILIGELV